MRQRKWLIYAVFGSISLALLSVAALLHAKDPNGIAADIVKDVGIVVGSLGLVDLLWGFVGGDPLSTQIERLKSLNQLNDDAERAGLVRVFARSAEYHDSSWTSLVQASRSAIELSGHTLYQVVEQEEFCNALVAKAREGVQVRILVNHPDNPALPHGVDPNHNNLRTMQEEMAHSWQHFKQLRESLPLDRQKNFEVSRLEHGGVLHAAIRRFDERLFIVPYLYSKRTPETPLYIVEDGSKELFKAYAKEFEALFAFGRSEDKTHPGVATDELVGRPSASL